MKEDWTVPIFIAVWILSLTAFGGWKMYQVQELENHIQYLEEYIEDNGLPTPVREPCPV